MSNENISQTRVSFYNKENMIKILIRIILWITLSLILLYGYFFFFTKSASTIWSITLLDRDGKIITQVNNGEKFSLPYTWSIDIPLIQWIISIEDKRFYEHFWTDIFAKWGSILQNIKHPDILRGGSTITEQYVKNKYFPESSRNIFQKIRETIVAQIIEIKYSKEEILRKYLDSVYMGNGIYGIQNASEKYFQKSNLKELTHEEIGEIIIRIHSPNLSGEVNQYANKVFQKLSGKDFWWIYTALKWEKQINKNILLTERIKKEINNFCKRNENHLIDFVKEIPQKICAEDSLLLQTTIDEPLSESIENIMEWVITPLERENIQNGAVYIKENKTGKILAYIGNRKEKRSWSLIDMIEERRSVGSVLKPFVYKLAIENGADGESLLLDDTKVYETEDAQKKYIPENYVPKSYWPVRLKEALWNSLNTATVRLSEKLGIGKIADFYKTHGLNLDHESGYYGYGISLGSVELSLENIVEWYTKLSDLSDPSNFLIYQILSDKRNRAKTFGYSSILNTSLPIAVKTGTSTDFRDNWTIGYSEDITIWVWIGNADGSSMQDVSGVTGAGPIFHQIAETMIKKKYIKNGLISTPTNIIENYRCLDLSCFQKEHTYSKKWNTQKSILWENIYYESDFLIPLTLEEKIKWKIK